MALTYGFYDSIDGDRTYNAEQFSRFFDGIISDGVIKAVGSKFQVTAGSGLAVRVGSGRAWFNHTWTYNDSDITVSLPAAHATLPRIDSIILSIDEQARTNSITYKQGTAASTPSAPTLTNSETLHEYRLANIAIAATATSISAANITQIVGETETPYATLSDMNIDYNTVANRPSINGVLLTGNKTTANLNISYNDLSNRPSINGVTLSGNKTTSNLNISYNDLSDRPSINGVTLSGNKTTADLSISYNNLTNKPTFNARSFSGAFAWSPGALNSVITSINHATIDWQYNALNDCGPVLRFTANLPTAKNGGTIRKILISFKDGIDEGLDHPHFSGNSSSSGKAYDGVWAIITKSVSAVSGLETYFVECHGGYFENGKEYLSAMQMNWYYNRVAAMDSETEIADKYTLFGGDIENGNGFANAWCLHYPCDLRFGEVWWDSNNVLHYAMQEYYCSRNDTYVTSSNNVNFKVVVLE